MKTIILTRGKVALVDDADFEALSKFKWYALDSVFKSGLVRWRAARNISLPGGKQGKVFMHQQLLGFPDAEVDHKNRNSLDNQRFNLRFATDSQQSANRGGWNSSGFKGVKQKPSGRYEARIYFHRAYYLGRFDSAIEAALAYDKAARRYFGEFACLNFPRIVRSYES